MSHLSYAHACRSTSFYKQNGFEGVVSKEGMVVSDKEFDELNSKVHVLQIIVDAINHKQTVLEDDTVIHANEKSLVSRIKKLEELSKAYHLVHEAIIPRVSKLEDEQKEIIPRVASIRSIAMLGEEKIDKLSQASEWAQMGAGMVAQCNEAMKVIVKEFKDETRQKIAQGINDACHVQDAKLQEVSEIANLKREGGEKMLWDAVRELKMRVERQENFMNGVMDVLTKIRNWIDDSPDIPSREPNSEPGECTRR